MLGAEGPLENHGGQVAGPRPPDRHVGPGEILEVVDEIQEAVMQGQGLEVESPDALAALDGGEVPAGMATLPDLAPEAHPGLEEDAGVVAAPPAPGRGEADPEAHRAAGGPDQGAHGDRLEPVGGEEIAAQEDRIAEGLDRKSVV